MRGDVFRFVRKKYKSEIEYLWLSAPIYVEGELDEAATCRKSRQVRTEGSRQLDAILSSGGRQLLKDVGSVSHTAAIEKAHSEYHE